MTWVGVFVAYMAVWKASEEIWFRPSRPLYDKYLKRKKFYKSHRMKDGYPVPAFDAVGYQDDAASTDG